MNDQVYFVNFDEMAHCRRVVAEYFPEAYIRDMPEPGTPHQFGVTLPDALGDDYVLLALRRGFTLNSKGLVMMMNMNPAKFRPLFNRWRLETGQVTEEELAADAERESMLDAEEAAGGEEAAH